MKRLLVVLVLTVGLGILAMLDGGQGVKAVCFCAWQANNEPPNLLTPSDGTDNSCPTTSSSAGGETYSSVPNIICDIGGDGHGMACYTDAKDCGGAIPSPTPIPQGVIQGCRVLEGGAVDTVGEPATSQKVYVNGVQAPTISGKPNCYSYN